MGEPLSRKELTSLHPDEEWVELRERMYDDEPLTHDEWDCISYCFIRGGRIESTKTIKPDHLTDGICGYHIVAFHQGDYGMGKEQAMILTVEITDSDRPLWYNESLETPQIVSEINENMWDEDGVTSQEPD